MDRLNYHLENRREVLGFGIDGAPRALLFLPSTGHRLIAWLYYFISKNNFLLDIPYCHGRQLSDAEVKFGYRLQCPAGAPAFSVAYPMAWDASIGGLYYP